MVAKIERAGSRLGPDAFRRTRKMSERSPAPRVTSRPLRLRVLETAEPYADEEEPRAVEIREVFARDREHRHELPGDGQFLSGPVELITPVAPDYQAHG